MKAKPLIGQPKDLNNSHQNLGVVKLRQEVAVVVATPVVAEAVALELRKAEAVVAGKSPSVPITSV